MGLRDSILAKDDLPRQSVEVPEWDCTVDVRTMTARERDSFEGEFLTGGKNQDNFRARLAVRTVVDPETGERVFADEDIPALGDKSAKALDRIFPVAMKLNGLSDSDVEELEKN